MRTTLTIDDDVLSAARERARREHRTVGQVISEVFRQGLSAPLTLDEDDDEDEFLGFRPLPATGRLVTNEMIDAIREEIGE